MITLAAASSSSSPSASTPSPAVDVDLICHTDNSSECYPKIFVPTDEFQTVHEDQDLPPGLHVRLNVWTGHKEAKINVPDEQVAEVAGLPVDSSVVVVDQPNEEEIQIPAGAPVYEAAGKIREPPKGEESDSFFESLEILKKGLNLDEALKELEELSHDIYYGLKITEQYDTVKKLLCLANTDWQYGDNESPVSLRRAIRAANIIAYALQNNPKALAEVEKHWEKFKGVKCNPADGDDLVTETFRLLPPGGQGRGLALEPTLVKARVSALKALLKSEVVRKDFFENRGMEVLLNVLVQSGDQHWDPPREKAALLVQDIFLDADLGATLGEWPVDDQLSEGECRNLAQPEPRLAKQECWDYEAKKLASENRWDQGHWSHELWEKLKEARKGVKATERWRDEL
jgi:nucleotide exchange factor SIL1